MPTYEYKREDGTTFEVLQRISDDPFKNCPETGQKVKRIITGGGGVVYKGSGWYVTDYKNKSSNGSDNSNTAGTTANGSNSNSNGSDHSGDSSNKTENSKVTSESGKNGSVNK